MALRQQLLFLWLAEAALDALVVGWAFHDGADGHGTPAPEGSPPYPDGVAALRDGWFLLQAPSANPLAAAAEPVPGALSHEFVFERRVEVSA